MTAGLMENWSAEKKEQETLKVSLMGQRLVWRSGRRMVPTKAFRSDFATADWTEPVSLLSKAGS